MKQKIEGNGRLEDEDKMLKRLNLGDGPARRTGWAADAYAISADPWKKPAAPLFHQLRARDFRTTARLAS